MRKFTIIGFALLLFSALPAFAGQFGPAEPQTKSGQFSLGFGLFSYSDEWDFDGITTDVRQTQAFVQVNFGLFPNWETYVKVGGADVRADDILVLSDFRDSFQPYGTAGLKGLFRRGKYVDVGGFVEGSYFASYEDRSGAAELEIDESFAVNAGLTFQKQIEGALLYGGPFFHYREADFDSNFIGSGTAEEDSNLGGFLGIRWTALGDIVVEGEVQLRDNFSAGAAVSFLF